jgi:beta-galactosidase
LTLNGRVVGTKQLSDATNGALRWALPYQPGTLKAIGHASGTNVCEYMLQTAGAASRIELLPDAMRLQADGKDICHLEFRVVDDQGVRVPDAEPEVTISVNGSVALLGIENGDASSPEPYQESSRKAFHGRGLAILQSTTTAGKVRITATAPGLKSTTAELEIINGN